jgi:hypothetical protein
VIRLVSVTARRDLMTSMAGLPFRGGGCFA